MVLLDIGWKFLIGILVVLEEPLINRCEVAVVVVKGLPLLLADLAGELGTGVLGDCKSDLLRVDRSALVVVVKLTGLVLKPVADDRLDLLPLLLLFSRIGDIEMELFETIMLIEVCREVVVAVFGCVVDSFTGDEINEAGDDEAEGEFPGIRATIPPEDSADDTGNEFDLVARKICFRLPLSCTPVVVVEVAAVQFAILVK